MRTQLMRRLSLACIAVFAVFAAGACGPETPNGTSTTPPPTSPPASTASPAISPEVANPGEAAVQKLPGRWKGPEGTYLLITELKIDGKQQNPRKFDIEIANLDGPKKYKGETKNGTIEFSRNGKTETIKAATGEETGMKGFEKETDCVVVTKGSEGFCGKTADPAASPANGKK